MTDTINFAFQRGFGGALMPLNGKIPALDGWRTMPPPTEDQVREWVELGFNLGLRTGYASGLLVIDDDQCKHDIEQPWVPPPTGLICESPTGSRHYCYRAPYPCPGNSASSKLAPYVDTRGEGGYVVYAGSAHPITRTPYRWVETGEPAELPEAVLAMLRTAPAPERPAPAPAPSRNGNGWADTALHSEVHRVRTAPPGARNDQLNRSAFALGQIVAGGGLDHALVESELTAAAKLAGDGTSGEDRKIADTVRRGLRDGGKEPRTAPERVAPSHHAPRRSTATQPTPAPAEPQAIGGGVDVLIPGLHNLPPEGETVEQGNDDFAHAVLTALPDGTLYRRAEIVGQIVSDPPAFRAIKPAAFRSVVDRSMRLGAGKELKQAAIDGSQQYAVVYRNCLQDHATLVLSYAETDGPVRDLQHLATHPVVLGRSFQTAQPGWNADHGVYLAVDHVPDPLDLETARAVLDDLVCDFPFQGPADRANFFGLMLTPLLRPAIGGNVPMHLINSPIERSGKTKLAEIVLGGSILGSPTPAMQLGEREEERQKQIMSTLVEGRTILHLDNLAEFLNSPSLASLLTSTNYVGRILGSTENRSVRNTLTVVGTGNNVHATGEIAKRIVPIRLLPPTDSPETRQDFRHPIIEDYVPEARLRVLGALLGLVEAWRSAGRPMAGVGFGGFERWAAVVGGIMQVAGYPEWLSNLQEWRGGADDFTQEVGVLCNAWYAAHGNEWISARTLYDLATTLDIFGWLDKAKTERGKRTSFGMRVLNRIKGRAVLGTLMVDVDGVGEARQVRLCQRCE